MASLSKLFRSRNFGMSRFSRCTSRTCWARRSRAIRSAGLEAGSETRLQQAPAGDSSSQCRIDK
eukprot:9466183-Alexandrium_andersonii.AAC.1